MSNIYKKNQKYKRKKKFDFDSRENGVEAVKSIIYYVKNNLLSIAISLNNFHVICGLRKMKQGNK